MNSFILILILLLYLGLLFVAAQWAERKAHSRFTNNPYVYALSLAVYCTAWTYYGSIGLAANSGLEYLTTYLGPVIIAPAWILILKKIIRISRVNKITGIADFLALRYGNSRLLGAVVTVICVTAILPYIGLQLKSISETFHVVAGSGDTDILDDTATYVALLLALFTTFYGARYGDATEKRKGVVTVVAIESIIKLFVFVLLGVYVTFFAFGGMDDIYAKASALPGFSNKNTIHGLEGALNWFFYCLLSMLAIFLLPRQFHMAVVENNRERHIRHAIWLFPLYLLLFNLFVFPIAWGGNVLFEGSGFNAELYALHIPLHFGNKWMALIVFLGGISAAISMVIVSSISLSVMLANNLLIPYGLLGRLRDQSDGWNDNRIIILRRIGIFLLITSGYIYYRYFLGTQSLVSVGMISFVVIAQLAPAFFGAIFWKRGSLIGVLVGLGVGLATVGFTLLLPFFRNGGYFIEHGLFGNPLLKPFALFGLDYLDPIPHALFWSLLFNIICYLYISVGFRGNYRQRNYAEMYVDIDKYIENHENAFVWKGTAYVTDITAILNRFLGSERTSRALKLFYRKYGISGDNAMADARMVKFAEKLLSGHIGTASAHILIRSVTKEDKISLPEVLRILEESKEQRITNKKLSESAAALKQLSGDLQSANSQLIVKDKQKDEFLDTVTHELRTPITAIRAASEILQDDPDIPEALRQQFLNNIISESDRLNRLIDKILDLERFESGKRRLLLEETQFLHLVRKSIEPLRQLMDQRHISLQRNLPAQDVSVWLDRECLIQVLTNLFSNAIKFARPDDGVIAVSMERYADVVQLSLYNNGANINPEDLENIFDKFYQSDNQNIRKPVGSGLGLAITRQIIELHKGRIWAKNHNPEGVTFTFTLPVTPPLP